MSPVLRAGARFSSAAATALAPARRFLAPVAVLPFVVNLEVAVDFLLLPTRSSGADCALGCATDEVVEVVEEVEDSDNVEDALCDNCGRNDEEAVEVDELDDEELEELTQEDAASVDEKDEDSGRPELR